jgi:alpha-N-arabinofuranosidase
MKKIPHRMMDGLSLHYYTTNWSKKGSATQFGEDLYFDVLKRCLRVEVALDRHIDIMERYDPKGDVALIFDEWGTWYDVEPGTNPGFLFQQNSMRDALVAALTLNYLNERCERIKMANIAQTINVLQALIFTDGEKMMLTPTYHIYDMFKVHHDASMLPISFESPEYIFGEESLPAMNASASMDKNGKIHITLVNIDPHNPINVSVDLRGTGEKEVTGTLLSSKEMNSYNTFEKPREVVPVEFKDATVQKDRLEVRLPARSVVVLEIL